MDSSIAFVSARTMDLDALIENFLLSLSAISLSHNISPHRLVPCLKLLIWKELKRHRERPHRANHCRMELGRDGSLNSHFDAISTFPFSSSPSPPPNCEDFKDQ
jgi:hypothetical protein